MSGKRAAPCIVTPWEYGDREPSRTEVIAVSTDFGTVIAAWDAETRELVFVHDPRETPEQERIRRAFCERVVREGRKE